MPTWTTEGLTEQAEAVMFESSQRDPRLFCWGLYSWGDAPPGIGGGTGCFQWFVDLPSVLAYVTDLSPGSYTSFSSEAEWMQFRDTLRAIASRFEADPGACITDLNAQLRRLLQIEWIGRFEALLSAEEPFPRQVRSTFRYGEEAGPAADPARGIAHDELDDFIESLDLYGI